MYFYCSQNGETPLHLASKGCKSQIVEHLIQFVKEFKGPEVCKKSYQIFISVLSINFFKLMKYWVVYIINNRYIHNKRKQLGCLFSSDFS